MICSTIRPSPRARKDICSIGWLLTRRRTRSTLSKRSISMFGLSSRQAEIINVDGVPGYASYSIAPVMKHLEIRLKLAGFYESFLEADPGYVEKSLIGTFFPSILDLPPARDKRGWFWLALLKCSLPLLMHAETASRSPHRCMSCTSSVWKPSIIHEGIV